MTKTNTLLDLYLPPAEGFSLESLVATTYQIDFAFLEEELLAAALGVRSPVCRMRAFRSELEHRLRSTSVTVLYDLAACSGLARLSPRVDPLPVHARKLHAKISLVMWSRPEVAPGQRRERYIRLIIGSANLTRQAFRENYEYVVAMDYGLRGKGPKALLYAAISLVRRMGSGFTSAQLSQQLDEFEAAAKRLPPQDASDDDPVALVTAEDVVSSVNKAWTSMLREDPEVVTIVSPFWPEGSTAADAIARLVATLGKPSGLQLVCAGSPSVDGKSWIPVFDSDLAEQLAKRLSCKLLLRPALPDHGVGSSDNDDFEDETEDAKLASSLTNVTGAEPKAHRTLHAKMLLLDGPAGSVLYVGSSNCTRRGLALGGPANWEAGFVYRLRPPQRKLIEPLLGFAAAPIEVLPGQSVQSIAPIRKEVAPAPVFILEVTAWGTKLTIQFRPGQVIPSDLELLMEIPCQTDERQYWVLMPKGAAPSPGSKVNIQLTSCQQCDANRRLVEALPQQGQAVPNVQIEVHWQGHTTMFPVRFEDKASLPLMLAGRKPTEGELI